MKNIMSIIGALAVAFFMPLSALAENSVPAIPVLVYGNVTINGAVAPVGTVVKAEAGAKEVGSFVISVAGKYAMGFSQDDIAVGSVVKFKVGGKDAGQTTMVKVDEQPSVKLDLAITTTSSGGSSGGGGTGGSTGGTTGGNTQTVPTTVTPIVPPVGTVGEEEGRVLGATTVGVVDGDIIQCKTSADPNAVYIVKIVNGKKYIRHIVSLEIFNFYKHLKWENLIQVASLDEYSLSGWVRVNTGGSGQPGAGDKVYEINGDQTRHWIDMTAAEFLLHGGSDEAIYNINAGELSLYREGAAVKLM